MATAVVEIRAQEKATGTRFYRRELDVLRFMAFLAVFICHGPRAYVPASAPEWKIELANFLQLFAHYGGAFGVCLFFLLSSYLITELLLRERETTGTVHLKAFYARRILRIWPLYYLGVALAVAVGYWVPSFALTRGEIVDLVFFMGWKGGTYHLNPMGPLWSISCEEVFYAIWPAIAKWKGAKSVLIACAMIVPISLTTAVVTDNSWYNPLCLFFFFALGALLALLLHGRDFSIPNGARIPAALFALAFWCYIIWAREMKTGAVIVAAQLGLAVTYVLFFFAFYGCPAKYLPRPLIFLGRISYGLYVFHLLCFTAIARLIVPLLPGDRLLVTYALALPMSIGLAWLSFCYFEEPFLKLKQRFTFVKSRDSGGANLPLD